MKTGYLVSRFTRAGREVRIHYIKDGNPICRKVRSMQEVVYDDYKVNCKYCKRKMKELQTFEKLKKEKLECLKTS